MSREHSETSAVQKGDFGGLDFKRRSSVYILNSEEWGCLLNWKMKEKGIKFGMAHVWPKQQFPRWEKFWKKHIL